MRPNIAWTPNEGGQQALMECPVFEVLLEGNRGGGKTDVLIMDFAQHVGKGFGAEWRGILFRQTFPQLKDVVAKSKKWFPQIWPAAAFNESKFCWTWPTGETLHFSYIQKEADYWNYHGHEYPWIGFEELTTWADDKCYRIMMSCSRSSRAGMPRSYRATTNPYGPGHNWVKTRFQLPIEPGRTYGRIIREDRKPPRVAIRVMLNENKRLLAADPDYQDKVLSAAPNIAAKAAWEFGDWNIVAGGMFDDVWAPAVHIVPDFDITGLLKTGWKLNRSYDHGQSHPFSVGWWAESNGEPIEIGNRVIGQVKGDVVRLNEWYGWNGSPNEGVRLLSTEIAQEIKAREEEWGMWGHFKAGPADASIFDPFEPGKSVAGSMAKVGVRWQPADKGPGSRKQGWEIMRQFMKGAMPGVEGVRESPGLFVCRRCDQFIRTIPTLPRDDKDLDNVDTNAEDHIADEARYRIRQKVRKATSRSF